MINLPMAKAAEQDFLLTKCLGIEEKLIHENKERGPSYQINQMLISIFITMPAINIHADYYKKLCNPPHIGTSIELLELIFRYYENLFSWSNTKNTQQLTSDNLEELFRKLPELFNQYLLEIKNKSPTADCLENSIVELKNFQTEVQYLGQDILFRTIAQKKQQLVKILDALKDKDKIFAKCQNELNKGSNK